MCGPILVTLHVCGPILGCKMLSESNYFDHLLLILNYAVEVQLLIVLVIHFYKSNKNTHMMVNILVFITCLTKNC